MKCSEKYEVYLSFPQTGRGKTVLALCGMKCRDGVTAPPRKVYVGPLVTAKLKEEKARQESLKSVFGDAYQDFDIVIAQDLGRPYEEHDIRKHLKELCKKSNLPVIVPHAMRHLSVTLKLLMSGDVKAVQADSGHKDAQMVYNRYSHALDTERRKLALDFDTALYSGNAV